MFLWNIVFSFFIAVTLAYEVADIPQVDHVIGRLSSLQWDDDEATCRYKILSLLHNVKNSTLWASWIWNSNPQAPTGTFFGARYHLGNYHQCLRPPWLSQHTELRTQYCLADIEMSKDPAAKNWDLPGPYAKAEDYYVDGGTDFGRSFSFMSYGVCLPAGCRAESVEKFVKALLSAQHLQAAWDADVKIHHCEEAGMSHVPPTGYYVFMYSFAALAFMAVASTYYIINAPVAANTNTFANHVAKSFCLRRNWATLFKEDKDELSCLHGIRIWAAGVIVGGHVYMFLRGTSVSNGLDYEKMTETFLKALPVVNFDLNVDIFFVMSSLLLGKSLVTLDISKSSVMMKRIAKRYLRLLGPVAVTVFYKVYILMQIDDGPMFPKIAKLEQQACEKNWWLALLMVGNYFNTDAMCYPATWYIACDFHFHVVTLVLLFIYRRNQNIGKVVAAVVIFLGFLGPAINTYIYDLSAVVVFNLGLDLNFRKSTNFNKGYIRTHNRMGPYVVGLCFGYMMSLYKPCDYKKKISKTTSFIGVCAGLSLMGAIFGISVLCYYYRLHGLHACIFVMFNRSIFAVAIMIIVASCTYGDVPLINSFLSWAPFKPLSRLSYGVYLIHITMLYRSKVALRDHARFHNFDCIVETQGLLMVSLILSLIVWLLVEAPLINFTSLYLDTRWKSKEKTNGIKNGVGPIDNAEKLKVK